METRQNLESAIQKLGGLSNLGNLSSKQLIEMYHLHMQLLYLNEAEDTESFLNYVSRCVLKLDQINEAYNRATGKKVDLWLQYRDKN